VSLPDDHCTKYQAIVATIVPNAILPTTPPGIGPALLLEPDDVDLDGEAADEPEDIFDAEFPDDDKDDDGDGDEDDEGIDDDEEDGDSAVDGEDPEDVDSGLRPAA